MISLQVFHPDKHASEEMREKAAEGFAVINEAYEVLSTFLFTEIALQNDSLIVINGFVC